MNNNKKLFLLDAYALIYRAFFALNKNPRINSKGMNTSAIMGFLNTLYEVIKTQHPTHIAVAFDTGPSMRSESFVDYKANREEMPDDIRASIPYIKNIISAFNIPIYAVEGYEADDVIGTLAKLAEKQGFTTYMMTPDKDFGQLVSDNIFIYKPAKFGEPAKVLGVSDVCEKYGIKYPAQLIDILGLWGDASDNIPGIPGIGEKTASKLVAEYDSMENIIAHASELKGKLRENVTNFAEQGLMSKALATIDVNVPIDFKPEEMLLQQPDWKKLSPILEELEFKTFMKRIKEDLNLISNETPKQQDLFSIQDNAMTFSNDLFSSVQSVEFQPNITDYQIVNNKSSLSSLLSLLSSSSVVALDVLLSSNDLYSSKILALSFSIESGKAFVLFFDDTFVFKDVVQQFIPVFSDESKLLVSYNIKSAVSVMNRYNIMIKNKLFDTMIAHYLIEPEQRHDFDYLSEIYLGHTPINIDNVIRKNKPYELQFNSTDDIFRYSGECADITLQLYKKLLPILTDNELLRLFYEIEMPLVSVLASMEANGVRIDIENLKHIGEEQALEIGKIENHIFELAGINFNISSPKQLGDVLFGKLSIKAPAKKTKSGQYPTGEEVLQKIIHEHEIVPLILEYRSLTKLKSTYVDALPSMVNKEDGLLHTSYNQAVTATGRLSSTNPNLQNIPVRTDKGKEIRRAFVPRDDDHILLAADYSQIELRIITHLSGDPAMTEAFINKLDIHADTASRVYHVPLNEVTKEMRRNAKMVNFGIIYGISAFGLAERLGISRSEASVIIKKYFEEYAGIREYIDKSIAFAKQHGYVETMLGRRRYLRDINASNSAVRAFAERNAINAPIQGSSADMIKIAMIDIYNELKANEMKSKMILQVHDELVFDACVGELDMLKNIVVDKMTNALKLSIPVVVDINVGKNWLEAH